MQRLKNSAFLVWTAILLIGIANFVWGERWDWSSSPQRVFVWIAVMLVFLAIGWLGRGKRF